VNTHIRARGRLVALLALGTVIVAGGGVMAALATAQVNPLRVSARQHVLLGRSVPVHGAIAPAQGGRLVLVQASRGKGWKTVARAKTDAHGRWQAKWRPNSARRYALRAILWGTRGATVEIKGGVTAYRAAAASWYGPGLYGQHLACGGTLDTGVVGVANKTMPCGSRVQLHYGGHTVVARVVDRGPYVAGREFDLTPATKAKLGFGSTGTVWAASAR
jgi:rare lipoprotein A